MNDECRWLEKCMMINCREGSEATIIMIIVGQISKFMTPKYIIMWESVVENEHYSD